MGISNKEAVEYVNKHVDLILCANNMTLIQRKAFNFLLHNAMPTLATHEIFHVNVKEIAKKIGYTSRDYRALADIIESLGDLKIKCRIVDSKTKAEDMISVNITPIPTMIVIDGICTYRYNPDIIKQLVRPSIYGRLNLAIQAKISSSYGLILYEVCEKYKAIGQTAWVNISDIRQLMGVEEGSYKQFRDFEKRVLQKAIDEVNSKTHFEVILEKTRGSKAVEKVKFIIFCDDPVISKNSQEPTADTTPDITPEIAYDNSDIKKTLIEEYGIKEKVAVDICKNHDIEYIKQKISIVKDSASYRAGRITNIAGQIVKAIAEDYQPPNSTSQKILQEKQKKYKEEQAQKQQEKLLEKQKNKYLNYLKIEVEKFLNSIEGDESSIASIRNGFLNYCDSKSLSSHSKSYKKNYDHTCKLVSSAFCNYMAQNWLQGIVKSQDVYHETIMEEKVLEC